ncbi:hydroxyphenylacetyl-CoA thioesterase PaaI [Ornithinimicrobium faecis]|uniref:hydroxyphenylacetyl-CoA thioesterase PaaI n=1 Tax=Ornithinimicrobium faecis TaxID=2934158 RepID=UPI0021197EA7|nr:hydroxyphenylacetyl-CoA thioesterase PaaI [Ornithinimicrobium sp. HY1745]
MDLTHVHTMWAQDRASAALGMDCLEVTHTQGHGAATVTMTVTDTMVNGHDICHGGLIFTLADSAFALACNAGGSPTVAATCDISFITAARLGDTLVATAVERVAYGRNGITDVTVTRAVDAAVVAEFRGRSRSIRPTAPA